ncbi:MAG: pilus assembly protein CpaB [Actinomycetota bacterium]|nr:pilus assembly protein CpaB [Actinomycetota bacterium]
MNYRAKNIGIAVALAALAAILTSAYVVNYKRHVQNGEGKVTVLVAARDIPAGTSGADVVDQKMLKEQTVPRKAVVAGAISSPDQLAQYVATSDVFQGEQVSTRRFAPPTEQGIRSQIKGTQRAYQLAGDSNQLLAGTLKEGDHVDVVGNWTVKVNGGNGNDHHVTRDILRNILVMRAPTGSGSSTVTTGDKSQDVQLRVTDVQSQKLFWIEKNGDWHLTLRPPVNAVDSGNTIQEVDTMYFDGPGRRP